jgi:hypothetical protein
MGHNSSKESPNYTGTAASDCGTGDHGGGWVGASRRGTKAVQPLISDPNLSQRLNPNRGILRSDVSADALAAERSSQAGTQVRPKSYDALMGDADNLTSESYGENRGHLNVSSLFGQAFGPEGRCKCVAPSRKIVSLLKANPLRPQAKQGACKLGVWHFSGKLRVSLVGGALAPNPVRPSDGGSNPPR